MAWAGGVKGFEREDSKGISQAALRASERISRWVSMSSWACEGRVARSMEGRTSGSGEIWEAGVVFVVVKARVFHCERGLGALRQACRRGVAMVGYMRVWYGCFTRVGRGCRDIELPKSPKELVWDAIRRANQTRPLRQSRFKCPKINDDIASPPYLPELCQYTCQYM